MVDSLTIEQRNRALLFGLCVAVSLCVFLITGLKPFRLIELKMLDYRFQLRGAAAASNDIILVSIGEKDIEILGRWPWPRKYHSDLIQILNHYGTKIIGYDILFCEPDKEDPESDKCLTTTMKESGNICFPMALSGSRRDGSDLLPLNCFLEASAGCGFVNVFPDEDGIVRRIPMKIEGHLSFGLELACLFLGIDKNRIELTQKPSMMLPLPEGDRIEIPLDIKDSMLINYAGTTEIWTWMHFVQVIMSFMEEQKGGKPNLDLHSLKGKIVIVGSTHTGMPDVIETPYGTSSYGLEFHAGIINSILNRNFLRPLSFGWNILIYLTVTLAMALSLTAIRPLKGGFLVASVIFAFLGVSYLLFNSFHIWIKVVRPVSGILAVYLTSVVFDFLVVERSERAVRRAFRHYVSPAVVQALQKDPERLKLGGEVKELTILFSDIRGFNTLSESMAPDLLGKMLNEYFSCMTDSVFSHEGTLDKFIGDAIMAIYGAPVDVLDHPMKACRSALSMLSSLTALNDKWEDDGQPPIQIGIGLNTGVVKVGNFGSQERFDYTVIGHNVNLASRLEGLTKFYGVAIVISEFTYNAVKEKMICRPLDRVLVKGSKTPVEIFELLGEKGVLPPDIEKMAREFGEGLRLYWDKKWNEARAFFSDFLERFPNDRPALILSGRAETFTRTPPPDRWGGVFSHITK